MERLVCVASVVQRLCLRIRFGVHEQGPAWCGVASSMWDLPEKGRDCAFCRAAERRACEGCLCRHFWGMNARLGMELESAILVAACVRTRGAAARRDLMFAGRGCGECGGEGCDKATTTAATVFFGSRRRFADSVSAVTCMWLLSFCAGACVCLS